MAEIRKHRPKTSLIGEIVRASVDPGPRPVEPGESQPRERYDSDVDPFFDEDEGQACADEQGAQNLSDAGMLFPTMGLVDPVVMDQGLQMGAQAATWFSIDTHSEGTQIWSEDDSLDDSE